MKRVLLAFVFIVSFIAVNAQTTIWEEKFDANTVYTTSATNGIAAWIADGTDNGTITGKGIAVFNNKLSGNQTNSSNLNTWQITAENTGDPIEISGYSNVTITIDLSSVSATGSNNILTQYSLNNSNTWTTFATNGNVGGNFGTAVASQIGLSGTTLRLRIIMSISGTTKFYYADNIKVTGTQAPLLTASPLSATPSFDDICTGFTAGPKSFVINGSNLTDPVEVGALTGYTYSLDNISYSPSFTVLGGNSIPASQVTATGGKTVYVKFNPTASGSYNGNIVVSSTGATSVNAAVVGNGISTPVNASGSFPANGAVEVCSDGGGAINALGWQAVPDATLYDVYIGTMDPPILFQSDLTTEYTTQNLNLISGETYYWYVIPKNNCGIAAAPTSNWSFTTASTACNDDYCDIAFTNVSPITKVTFNTIDNSSSASTSSPSYEDFKSVNTTVTQTSSHSLTVEAITGDTGNVDQRTLYVMAFFDWNHDNDFLDAGESIEIGTIFESTVNDTKSTSKLIEIPAGSSLGSTVMRVIASRYDYNVNPCVPEQDGNNPNTYGQTEDYTVNVCALPVAIAQNVTLYLDTNGNATLTTAAANNGSTANCGLQSLTLSKSLFTCDDLGINTGILLTVTDDLGNSDSDEVIVTVIDDIPPTITCAADVTIDTDPGECFGTTTLTPPTATDNCTDNALDFDGIDDSVNVNMSPNGLANTIEFWMHTDVAVNGSNPSMTVANFNGSNAHYLILNNFTSSINGETVSLNIGFSGNISTNTQLNSGWNHIAITSNGSIYSKIYFNGTEVPSTVSGSPAVINVSSMILGSILNQSLFFDGKLDDFRLWNSSRSQTQIQANMNSELSVETGLVASYHFNEGVANGNNTGIITATDASGNNYDGTLTNFALTGSTSNWVGEPSVEATLNGVPVTANTQFAVGPNTVTWTATDASGNAATCEQIVTVTDNEAPIISLIGDASITLEACTDTYNEQGATASDNCSVGTVTIGGDAVDTNTPGVYTVTYNVTDANNVPAAQVTRTVTVNDVTPAQVITEDISIDLDAAGNASIVPADVDNGSNDACGIASLTVSPNTFDCSNIGANTVTLTATDNNGNVSSATATVTVEDNVDPVLTAEADQDVNLDANCAITVPDLVDGSSATDNCTFTITQLPTAGTVIGAAHNGTVDVVVTATDAAGNTDSTTVTLTAKDISDPVLTAEADQDVNLDANCAITVPDLVDGSSATDNCTFTITQLPTAGTVIGAAHNGTVDVVVTATDAAGNTDSTTVTLTAKDVSDPVLTAEADQDVNLDANCAITVPDLVDGSSATDNCTFTITQLPTAGTVIGSAHNGTVDVVVTATDAAGNTDSTTVTLTAKDISAPVLTGEADQDVNLDANCAITVPDLVDGSSATDNCTFTITQLPTAGTVIGAAHNGTVDVVVTATDAAGNTDSTTVTLTAKDISAPVLTAEADQDVNLDANCAITVPDLVDGSSATDNCTFTITQLPTAGTVIGAAHNGTVDVVVTATDAAGNTDSTTVTLTAKDISDPVLTAEADQDVNLDANCAITVPDLVDGSSATDNCTFTITQLPTAGTVIGAAHNGTVDVVVTATDAAGNTDSTTVTLTAKDISDPMLTAEADQDVNLDANCAITVPDLVDGSSATDNCTFTITQLPTAGTVIGAAHNGTVDVVVTATDAAGNTDSTTVTLTAKDITNPTVSAATNVVTTTSAGSTGDCTVDVAISNATFDDNCSSNLTWVMTGATSGSGNGQVGTHTFEIGVTTITYTNTDAASNTATSSMTVTVTDDEDPVVSCPADITVSNDPGDCGAIVTFAPTATDNCSVFGGSTPSAPMVITGVFDGPITGGIPKAIEIYVIEDIADLSLYGFGSANNGGGTDGQEFTFPAVSATAGTYLYIATEVTAFTSYFGFAPNDTSGAASINGDDAIELFENGIVIDVFGTLTGGNSGWNYADGWAYRNDSTGPDGSTFVIGNWTFSGANATDGCVTNASCTSVFPIGTYAASSGGSAGTIVTSIASGSFFAVGTTQVTVTATDAAGNSSTCTFNVIVNDDEDPSITAAADQTQTADAGVCEALVTVASPTTGDNCAVASVVNDYNNTADASDTYPVGTTTITWTVTDIHGNSSQTTQDITVTDDEDPTITVVNQTQTADAGVCQALVTVASPTTGDNCAVASVVNDYNNTADASDTYPVGTTTITWTVTDIHGNTSQTTQDITVTDDEAPIVSCPADITVSNDPGDCGAIVTFAPTATDNCSVFGGSTSTPSVWINEFHYDNSGGDVGEFIEVAGTAGFNLTNYSIALYNGANGTLYNTINLTGNIDDEGSGYGAVFFLQAGIQNGNPDGIALINNVGGLVEFISYGGSFTATNGPISGQTSTNVGVTEPSSTPIGNSLQLIGAGSSSADFNWSGPSAQSPGLLNQGQTINAGTIVTSIASGSFFAVGTTQVTVTATDAAGNSSTCTFNVIVNDDEDPSITAAADQTQTADAGVCQALVTVASPTTGDNCAVASVVNDYNNTADASDTYPVGTTTITWTVTDIHGNSSQTTQDITVTDDEDPTITVSNQTQTADAGVCEALVTVASPTTGDNCGVASVVNDYNNTADASDTYPVGTTTITWTVTDIHGNSSQTTQDITVTDDEAPIIECTDLQVYLDENQVYLDGNGFGNLPDSVVDAFVGDNCDIASATLSQNDFDCDDIGGDLDELIISEYVDGSEIDSNNDGTLDVKNKWIEIFNGTGNPIVLGEHVNGAFNYNYYLDVYLNGSAIPTKIGLFGTIQDRGVFRIAHSGATLNSTNLNPQLQPFLFTMDGNDAIGLSRADNGQTVDYIPAQPWIDNVNLVRKPYVLQGSVSGDENEWISNPQDTYANLGSHDIEIANLTKNVTLTVTDTSGNVSTCDLEVQINDPIAPIAVGNDITIELDENGTYTLIPSDLFNEDGIDDIENGSSDACGIASYHATPSTFDCGDVGQSNPVSFTVTDVNGNVSDPVTVYVTVQDNLAPVAIAQDVIVQLDANGNGSTTAELVNNGSNDACGIASLVLSQTNFDCDDITTNPNAVTLTVTDNNGNVSTATANVTVEDNVDPVALCQDITIQLDEFGDASITAGQIDNGSNDACGIASISVSRDDNGTTTFNCADFDTYSATVVDGYDQILVPVTLTVTDTNGNVTTCNATVTVKGIIPDVTITQGILPEFCQGAELILTANTVQAENDIRSYSWTVVTGPGALSGPEDEKNVRVTGNGTYRVTVTSETNCSTSVDYTVTGFVASELLSSYTILAEDEVFLHGSNLVQSGGVGVTGANGLIKLHQASNIAGFGRATNITLNQNSSVTTPIYSPANITFPDFVYNNLSDNSSPNVTINNNQSQTLNGSVYGSITVKQGATVTFSQSNVYIDELKTFDGASIEFLGCTNVYINDKFTLAQNGTINFNGANVVMYVNEDVQIEKGSYVRARIHSNGNELLAKGANGNGNGNNSAAPTEMVGMFIAKKVHGSVNVRWNADPLCEPCATSNTNNTSSVNNQDSDFDDLKVTSWPNPSDTDFSIKITSKNTTDVVTISVFDMSNKLVHSDEFKPDQEHKFGNKLEGGVYIVKVSQGDKVKTVRLVKY